MLTWISKKRAFLMGLAFTVSLAFTWLCFYVLTQRYTQENADCCRLSPRCMFLLTSPC